MLEVDDAELALVSDPGGCTSDPEGMDPESTGSGGGGGTVDGALGDGGGPFGGGTGGTCWQHLCSPKSHSPTVLL